MIAVAVAQQEGLVSALRDGDEATFAVLVAELGPSMLPVARLYVSTAAVAEEVVQEALARPDRRHRPLRGPLVAVTFWISPRPISACSFTAPGPEYGELLSDTWMKASRGEAV
jgi:hypothetical protein